MTPDTMTSHWSNSSNEWQDRIRRELNCKLQGCSPEDVSTLTDVCLGFENLPFEVWNELPDDFFDEFNVDGLFHNGRIYISGKEGPCHLYMCMYFNTEFSIFVRASPIIGGHRLIVSSGTLKVCDGENRPRPPDAQLQIVGSNRVDLPTVIVEVMVTHNIPYQELADRYIAPSTTVNVLLIVKIFLPTGKSAMEKPISNEPIQLLFLRYDRFNDAPVLRTAIDFGNENLSEERISNLPVQRVNGSNSVIIIEPELIYQTKTGSPMPPHAKPLELNIFTMRHEYFNDYK